jgi:hypothetical protein
MNLGRRSGRLGRKRELLLPLPPPAWRSHFHGEAKASNVCCFARQRHADLAFRRIDAALYAQRVDPRRRHVFDPYAPVDAGPSHDAGVPQPVHARPLRPDDLDGENVFLAPLDLLGDVTAQRRPRTARRSQQLAIQPEIRRGMYPAQMQHHPAIAPVGRHRKRSSEPGGLLTRPLQSGSIVRVGIRHTM